MIGNLIVAFELRDWVRQGSLVVAAIEELGVAVRIFGTAWYVRSELSAEEAARRVVDLMHPSDGLLVIDTTTDTAVLFNVDEQSVEQMSRWWHSSPTRLEPEDIAIAAVRSADAWDGSISRLPRESEALQTS